MHKTIHFEYHIPVRSCVQKKHLMKAGYKHMKLKHQKHQTSFLKSVDNGRYDFVIACCSALVSIIYKYSLLMHHIKIKSPANVFMEWIKLFCGWIYHFSISLTLVVLQRQKKPTGYWRYYHLRCCRPPWLKCHWSVFPRAQLTITQYWFRQWLGAE